MQTWVRLAAQPVRQTTTRCQARSTALRSQLATRSMQIVTALRFALTPPTRAGVRLTVKLAKTDSFVRRVVKLAQTGPIAALVVPIALEECRLSALQALTARMSALSTAMLARRALQATTAKRELPTSSWSLAPRVATVQQAPP